MSLKKSSIKPQRLLSKRKNIAQDTSQTNDTQNHVASSISGKRNILVLDDDESVYQQMKSYFQEYLYGELGQ